MAWVLDLDGVVWLAAEPIPGAADAVRRLRGAGERVLFVTNNSSQRLGDQEAKLAAMGIGAEGDLVTSAMAAARLVEPGERALVCGGAGVREALAARGAIPVDDGDADVVVVGLHTDFTYDRMRIASTAVRRGARLVGTNDDATYPTPGGPIPGNGAILASVVVASGGEPQVAGKPHQPMADLIKERAGEHGIVVGDRADTDGLFARRMGFRFGLVLTGVVTEADLPVDPAPDEVAPDLLTLVDRLLG